ncbi:MAG: succinate dehydrogenase [Caldimonas sp.]
MKPSQTPAVALGIAQAKRWYWQRISAMVLALCVVVHLAVLIYATRGGLSAAEILGRTQGNWAFAAFYAVFVVACAVHVPLGLANVGREWLGLSEPTALWLARAFALLLLVMGLRAVWAVVS